MQRTSPFHGDLEDLFKASIDVQWTTGRLNYINGYTTKAHDAMDFTMDSSISGDDRSERWMTCYRLLCKKTVCMPETVLWFREAPPMTGSCRIANCYAPMPYDSKERRNDTERLYSDYLGQASTTREPFISHCRHCLLYTSPSPRDS